MSAVTSDLGSLGALFSRRENEGGTADVSQCSFHLQLSNPNNNFLVKPPEKGGDITHVILEDMWDKEESQSLKINHGCDLPWIRHSCSHQAVNAFVLINGSQAQSILQCFEDKLIHKSQHCP